MENRCYLQGNQPSIYIGPLLYILIIFIVPYNLNKFVENCMHMCIHVHIIAIDIYLAIENSYHLHIDVWRPKGQDEGGALVG